MPRSVDRSLRIVYDRTTSHRLRAAAGRVLAAYAEVHGAIGFGGPAAWLGYAAAEDILAAKGGAS